MFWRFAIPMSVLLLLGDAEAEKPGADSKTDFEQLKLLFEYTKFHIGLYTTLLTGLVALLSLGHKNVPQHFVWPLRITAICFVLAGFAGGVICGNIPEHKSFTELWDKPIGFWGLGIMPTKCWAMLEHTAFWVGIISALVALLIVKPTTAGRTSNSGGS
jgi:hypothetical protein